MYMDKIKTFIERRIGIVGAGRVGSNIAYWLAKDGWHIRAVYDKNMESARKLASVVPTGCVDNLEKVFKRCDIVFLTVPESAITEILEEIGEFDYCRTEILITMSGILPSDILGLAGMEFSKVSLHPLAGIPTLNKSQNPFYKVFFSVEGDEYAKTFAKIIVEQLGGYFWEIEPQNKTIYHTAGAFGANTIFSIIYATEQILRKSGFPEEHIRTAVAEAMIRVIENYRNLGLPDSITGPLARGDYSTVLAHLIALKDTEYLDLYIEAMRIYSNILGVRERFEELVGYI
ncbi:hypothetical protein DRQ29_07690 [bacterium]|nr:MAG: hypothetical protein DRQ29_07690 [bacterium]